MAIDHRVQSLKERRAAKKSRTVLIGRKQQQDWFERSLLQPEHGDAKTIFSISGQGGIGKTTLLREFRRIAEENGALCGYVNEGVAMNPVNDVPEVMWRLVEDLEQGHGLKFEKFRERYKAYRVKKQEMEGDPEAPKGFVGDATRGVMKVGLEAAKGAIPFGGMIDSEMVATKAGELMNYGIDRFRNKDEERLMKETLEVLTPLFLEGINRAGGNKTVVLLLDTYEVTSVFLDAWILAVLKEEFGDVRTALMVCMGGRNPLDRNVWTEFEEEIARSPLEPFTEAEARLFLGQKGILGEAVIAEIWRLSAGGLPLLVSMMALNAPTDIDAVIDPCDDAVTRFLRWETDEAKKGLALDGALGRAIDADVVAALGSELFDWLRGCPFVIREGSVWRYHSVVRELMVRFQWQKSRSHWTAVHGKLAAHYEAMRVGLGLESGKEIKDKEWQRLSLEWFYHSLCAGRQAQIGMALNGFLVALEESRVFALEWAEVMVMVGKETEWTEMKLWSERLQDGMVAHKEKRYSDAIPCLTKLIESRLVESKQKAVAYDWRGNWYRLSKQGSLGLNDFLKAIELDPENPKHYLSLGYTHQAEKRYEEATELYKKAIELSPEDATAYNNLGSTYSDQKRYEEAVESYKKAIELNPENSSAYNNLGSTYKAQKQYEEAIESYKKAIELNPEDATAHGNLGLTYYNQKRYKKAIEAYLKVIDLNSQDAIAYVNLGNAYDDQKNYEKAVKAYQKAIELNPEDANAHYNLGITYKRQKRYEEAIESYEKAIELNPEDASAYYNLGITYNAQKQYEEAIESYRKAIELNPEYVRAFARRGKIYRLLKRYEEALKDFDRAIELEPAGWPLSQRGQINLSLSRQQQALDDFNQAIELDNDCEWECYLRSIVHQNLNQADEAQADLQNAIDLAQAKYATEPEDWQNTFNLALYHLAAGHQQESESLYRSGLNAPQEMIEMAVRDLEDLREWRTKNVELRIEETISLLGL